MKWLLRVLFKGDDTPRHFMHETELSARNCLKAWEPAGIQQWELYELQDNG